jgi:hypothetical protein
MINRLVDPLGQPASQTTRKHWCPEENEIASLQAKQNKKMLMYNTVPRAPNKTNGRKLLCA